MEPNGQTYFDRAEKVPEDDVQRLKREMENVTPEFKERVQALMRQEKEVLERLRDG